MGFIVDISFVNQAEEIKKLSVTRHKDLVELGYYTK
jgi:hypothetical protein